MAVVDTEKGTSDVKDQVTRNKKYKQFKEGVNNLKKKAGSALEKSKTKTTSTLSNAKKFSKKNQRPVKNLFDNLLDINVLSNDRGGQVAKYLKRLFVKSLNELKSKIIELLTKDIVKSIG